MTQELPDLTAELAALHAELFGPESHDLARVERPQLGLDDEAVLNKMFGAANGAKVRRLFDGDTSKYGDDHSVADMALCTHLCFWTGGDSNQIDRLFRQSALYRDKWERQDYRERTIEAALRGAHNFYQGNGHHHNGATRSVEPADATQEAAKDSSCAYNLPDEFWSRCVILQHIRQAAHSCNRSADGVLHVVLARIAAMMDPMQRIDTGVGSSASLNYFVALVGPSGTGKSDEWEIGCRLLPAPDFSSGWFADNQPLGSGEGLAEAYMGTVEVPSENPWSKPDKVDKVRKQVRNNAFFFADEGEALTRLLQRSGATIGEALRRAWKGTPLGQRNGTVEHTRLVSNYAMGVVIGFQHSTVQPLLDDVSTGTPQRFVFVNAQDPGIPDEPVAWPGPLHWQASLINWQDWTLDTEIIEEIRVRDLARAQGREEVPPYDAHELLCKVKIAGLLAALYKRSRINLEDWELAGIIWQTSCTNRDALIAQAETAKHAKEEANVARVVRQNRAVDDDAIERALNRAEMRIVRYVLAHAEETDGCTRGRVVNSIARRDRTLTVPADALERALVHGGVVERSGRYWPGKRAK